MVTTISENSGGIYYVNHNALGYNGYSDAPMCLFPLWMIDASASDSGAVVRISDTTLAHGGLTNRKSVTLDGVIFDSTGELRQSRSIPGCFYFGRYNLSHHYPPSGSESGFIGVPGSYVFNFGPGLSNIERSHLHSAEYTIDIIDNEFVLRGSWQLDIMLRSYPGFPLEHRILGGDVFRRVRIVGNQVLVSTDPDMAPVPTLLGTYHENGKPLGAEMICLSPLLGVKDTTFSTKSSVISQLESILAHPNREDRRSQLSEETEMFSSIQHDILAGFKDLSINSPQLFLRDLPGTREGILALRSTLVGLLKMSPSSAKKAFKDIAGLYLNYKYGLGMSARQSKEFLLSYIRTRAFVDRRYSTRVSKTRVEWSPITAQYIKRPDPTLINLFAKDSRRLFITTAYLDREQTLYTAITQWLSVWDALPNLVNTVDYIPFSFVINWITRFDSVLSFIDDYALKAVYPIKAQVETTIDTGPSHLYIDGSIEFLGTVSVYDRRVYSSGRDVLFAHQSSTIGKHFLEAGALIIQKWK